LRHDRPEIVLIVVDAQGEAVGRDPAAGHADADGGDLDVPDPYAGEARLPAGQDVEVREGADEHLFEIADVAVQILAVRLQVEDRIADELARAAVGDGAAPAGLAAAV